MSDEGKKLALLIALKGKGGEQPPAPEGEDYGDDHAAAASDVLSAIKSGDTSALADALKNFVKGCVAED